MMSYILKRLMLMVFTLIMVSFLVFLIISLAPGRAGQTQLSGAEGESARDSSGAREGYMLFKLNYGLNLPLVWNTRFDLDADEVREAVETVTANVTASIPGETEALLVGRTTGDIATRLAYPEYFRLSEELARTDLSAEERAELERQRIAAPYQPVEEVRPPRPDPGDLIDAQENLEDWGIYAVPALYEVARNHPSPKVRWKAVDYLTLLAADRRVNPETRGIVDNIPERRLRRAYESIAVPALQWTFATAPHPTLASAIASHWVDRPLSQIGARTFPPTDLANWRYELTAPPERVAEVMARWDAWYERNAHRFEYDFWDKVGIFFGETRIVRYWGNLLRGDLGVSSSRHKPVIELIFDSWKYSIYLSLLSIFFAYFLSIPIGLYSAVRRGGLFDQGIGLVLFLFYSLPSYFAATLLQNYFSEANREGVPGLLHGILLALCMGLLPIIVAFAARGRVREALHYGREGGPGLLLGLYRALPGGTVGRLRGVAVVCLLASIPLGWLLAQALLLWGGWFLAFVLILVWPVSSALRAWKREREAARRSGVATDIPFPVGRLAGLAFAGAGLTWLFTLATDFFPAPVSGFSGFTDGGIRATTWELFKDTCMHLVFPVACLTYGSLAYLSRYARTGLLDVISSDYIRTARAKGLSEPVVILKHALRNGMIPILTLLASALPALVGGSVIIEYIFGIPGIGSLVLSAINQKDFNVVMAVLQISAVMTLAGILLSDISYALVDPRIKFD